MSNVINVHTVAMSQWRLAKKLGIPLYDITAKSGNHAFAPHMSLVVTYKAGMISADDYTDRYVQKMRESLASNPTEWLSLLEYKDVAFACYCPAGQFCHRNIFITLFKKFAERHGYVVNFLGEIQKGVVMAPTVHDELKEIELDITATKDRMETIAHDCPEYGELKHKLSNPVQDKIALNNSLTEH